MDKDEESGSPGWTASLFIQTTEDVARAVAAVAAAATAIHSPRPSVIYSAKDENSGSQLQKLQRQVTRVLKGFSHPPEAKSGTYNPEVLTSQKRQWARFQLQSLDHRSFKEPSRFFESMVVVGLPPNCDIEALKRQFFSRNPESSGKFRNALGSQHQSRVEPSLEPQVLFLYPPDKQLPLKYKDLLSFCFPGGVEIDAVERTPSMSELNEILLAQEHLKQSNLSFVFRLQVADDSTLYGCCVLVEEIIQKPSVLISLASDKQSFCSPISRHIVTTHRCYCIISRLPFFELHFGVLNSIFNEERLERLTKGIDFLDLEPLEGFGKEANIEEKSGVISKENSAVEEMLNETMEVSRTNLTESSLKGVKDDGNKQKCQTHEKKLLKNYNESGVPTEIPEVFDVHANDLSTDKQTAGQLPDAVSPLLRHSQSGSSDFSCSFQSSSCEGRNFRSDEDETGTEEASCSGQVFFNDRNDILEWAKANHHGSLQIICEYYRLRCPARGSTLMFHPLEHLHPLEFHRSDETILHTSGPKIDLRSCTTSLELAEAHNALLAEEEANALSAWAVACVCGSFRLDHVLTMFAGALLEKQIVVVCSNLGILSASVLSIIPLIRPFRWQSLLMPVLPNDMLDFLDAPVPYVVGVKNKTTEVQSKLTNVILVDANKNQVKSPSLPQLPQRKELLSSLSPYYAKLVGESYLARKRPVYECTDVQTEAAKGFLRVLRTYLDSLCSNLRSHTITNVQSNDDKVSLLLKESFIDSFAHRDRPFMKLFVDTQLFSVHTDLVLSFFQKE